MIDHGEKETVSENGDDGAMKVEIQVGQLKTKSHLVSVRKMILHNKTKVPIVHTFVGLAVHRDSRAITGRILKRLDIGSANHTLHIQNAWDTRLLMSEASLLAVKAYLKSIRSIVLDIEGLHCSEEWWRESSMLELKAGRNSTDHECQPEVVLLLYNAPNDGSVCNTEKGALCGPFAADRSWNYNYKMREPVAFVLCSQRGSSPGSRGK
ncbi:hypothetical protein BKA64DRAFT_707274 [Cadophora sp. MPI-SDFR-AT-0126]|nr:hypothetical protein BKA64DRAFT_707274 [Leotiomycetes sp. MPI-SDFR-AT-0126]